MYIVCRQSFFNYFTLVCAFVTRIIAQDNCRLMLVEYKSSVEQYPYLVPREDFSPHKSYKAIPLYRSIQLKNRGTEIKADLRYTLVPYLHLYLHKERNIHSRAKQLYTIELLLQNLGSLLYVILFLLLYLGIEFSGRVEKVIILSGVES